MGRLSRALRTGMLSLAVIASSLAIVPFAAAPASALSPAFVSPRSPSGWAYDMVRADEAQALGVTGRGIRVAILDNGIDPRATGITGRVVASFDAVHSANGQQEHGTATAGIVAAATNLEAGIGGIAPDVEILNVKVCTLSNCRTEAMISGLKWSIDNGANIISMSIGGSGVDGAVAALIEDAVDAGIVVVAAAGNSACFAIWESQEGKKNRNCTQTSISRNFPGSYPTDGLITVGAVDRERKRANYSSYNAQVDVAAPGTGVATTFPWGPNADFGGTSAATPVVAGVAALVMEAAPSLTPAQVQSVIQLSAAAADNTPPDVWDSCVWNAEAVKWDCVNLSPAKWPARFYTGAGVVDAVAAVTLARELEAQIAAATVGAVSVAETDSSLAIDWSVSGLGAGPYKVSLDGEDVAQTVGTSIVLNELINEATYSVRVSDASGKFTLPVLARPSDAVPVAAFHMTNLRSERDGMYPSITEALPGNGYGALLLSDGVRVSCSGYSCDYSMPAGTLTARYVSIDSFGRLSEPSQAVSVTSIASFPAPQNIVISDITATSIKASWDAVPGAAHYYYYDAGAGEWKVTTDTTVSMVGLKTGLTNSFRVAVSAGQASPIGVWSPWHWYYAYPPELPALTGLSVKSISAKEVAFSYTKHPDTERIVFFRSDGKVQYMPATSPELMDRFNDYDAGKTYSYYFVQIDDLQYGSQFGVVAPAFTITVPMPKKVDNLTTDLTNEPLQYESEREFIGTSTSGKQVWWWAEGPCQMVSQNGPKFRVRANGVNADCVVKGNTQEDEIWDRGYIEVRIPMIKKVETISLTGTVALGLEYKKEMVLSAQGNSNRPLSWFIDGNCMFVETNDRWARVRANAGQGNCKVEARLYENEWFTGATASVDQGMVLQKEKLTIISKSQIWDRRTISLRYETATGRTPVFKTTGMCRIVKVTKTHVQVASRFTFGSCQVTSALAATSAETGATSSTRVALLTHKPQRKADMFND
ncbi:MAG: S8 family serine peptidase [Rhodoluna sp.]